MSSILDDLSLSWLIIDDYTISVNGTICQVTSCIVTLHRRYFRTSHGIPEVIVSSILSSSSPFKILQIYTKRDRMSVSTDQSRHNSSLILNYKDIVDTNELLSREVRSGFRDQFLRTNICVHPTFLLSCPICCSWSEQRVAYSTNSDIYRLSSGMKVSTVMISENCTSIIMIYSRKIERNKN